MGYSGRPLADKVRRIFVWLLVRDRWAFVVAGVIFAAFVLSGMTTSSIGMPQFTEDPSHSTVLQIGQPQWIRSDEYNVNSPLWMSIMSTGNVPTLSPLAAPAGFAHRFSTGGFFSTIVFFQSDVLWLAHFLPERMVFSLTWWLPMMLLVFTLPLWVEKMGGTRRLGWFATLLIAFSPSVAWWSLGPVSAMAFAVAGSYLLAVAVEQCGARRWGRFALAACAAAVLLATIPTVYAPWSIILGVSVLVVTMVRIASMRLSWTARIVPVCVIGGVAAILTTGTFLENRAGLEAMLGTVYPGSRRSGSAAQPFGALFGAPGFDALARHDPSTSNASELSASFTVCVVWAAILFASARLKGGRKDNIAVFTLAGFTGLWLAWCTVSAGSAGALLPILNLVPAYRAGQVVGILSILLVALVLSRLEGGSRFRTALVSAVAVGLVSAYGVSLLRTEAVPSISGLLVLGSATGAAAVAFLMTMYPEKILVIAISGVLAFLTVARSQPILFGLGELHDSATAKAMRSAGVQARSDGTFWATDSSGFESLMLANGVPSLSGFQRSGPDVAQWEKLDPERQHEQAWNRGGGYVPFIFKPHSDLKITTSGFDITWVQIDPCVLKAKFPKLTRIATTQEMQEGCLVRDGSLEWGGQRMKIYELR